jgi:hypothetical protein
VVAWLLLLLGTAGAVLFSAAAGGKRIWPAVLVNLLFWSGISMGGVVFSGIVEMTNSRWGRPFKRIAELSTAFLPVSFLVFVAVIFFGSETLGWNTGAVKRIWLTMPFLAVRDISGLAVLYTVALYYVFLSLRPDMGKLMEEGRREHPLLRRLMLSGWKGSDTEVERKQSAVRIFAPILILLFCVIETLIGIDFVMALDPAWFSTLFGAFFFMGYLYTGLAFTAVVAILLKRRMSLGEISADHMHDHGKLLFGICLIVGDFFWSQFLVIWYGNLPEETSFVILRAKEAPWAPFGWTVLAVAFVIPFISLIGKKLKTSATGLLAISLVILIGMWLEKYLFVVPSIVRGTAGIPFGLPEISITAAFAGIFLLAFIDAMGRFPILPITDPLFHESQAAAH